MSRTVEYHSIVPAVSDNRPDLNWHQARELLKAGFAIELPEFKGWWFVKDDMTMVRTQNGELKDSPWIAKYKDRDDWRVSYQTMDFSQAIRFAQNGANTLRSENLRKDRNPLFACLHKSTTAKTPEQIVDAYQGRQRQSFLKDVVSEDWIMLEPDALVPGQS